MPTDIIESNVKFLVDKRGRRTHVVLPIKEYKELLEDLNDLAAVGSRSEESAISLDELKVRLYGTTNVPD